QLRFAITEISNKDLVSVQRLWPPSNQVSHDHDNLRTARARTPVDAKAGAASERHPGKATSPYVVRTAIKDSMSPTPGVITAMEETMSPTPGVVTAVEETMTPTRGVDTAKQVSTTPRKEAEFSRTPQTASTRTALPNFSPSVDVTTAHSIESRGSTRTALPNFTPSKDVTTAYSIDSRGSTRTA
ncbi:hypothetical protein OSTOST_02418, partial [Ostertagia ostertagi]